MRANLILVGHGQRIHLLPCCIRHVFICWLRGCRLQKRLQISMRLKVSACIMQSSVRYIYRETFQILVSQAGQFLAFWTPTTRRSFSSAMFISSCTLGRLGPPIAHHDGQHSCDQLLCNVCFENSTSSSACLHVPRARVLVRSTCAQLHISHSRSSLPLHDGYTRFDDPHRQADEPRCAASCCQSKACWEALHHAQ